jgi:5-oxoprolinase (ATP-hydrolysing) subunit A
MDLNADLGEGFGIWRLGDDHALLDLVTSANVACGFHGGDASTMRRVCAAAAERGVAIGAQVGYRDLAGFGRRHIAYDFAELRDEVTYQLGALEAFCRLSHTRVRYLKPHGALYHAVIAHEGQARAVVQAVLAYGGLPVLGPPGSLLLTLAAEAELPTVPEGFADRAYRPDGSLVPRGEPGAVLTDPAAAAEQAVTLAERGDVRSLCVHGDSPGAAEIAAAVRAALDDAGVTVAAFA